MTIFPFVEKFEFYRQDVIDVLEGLFEHKIIVNEISAGEGNTGF